MTTGYAYPCPSTFVRNIWTCYCRRPKDHTGDHECKCGVKWPRA